MFKTLFKKVQNNVEEPALQADLEAYFAPFRAKIVGIDQEFEGPYGKKQIIYADWIASGRLYAPIEEKLSKNIGPFVANTHTETSYTGTLMTNAYDEAKSIIKQHVGANKEDVIIPVGTGMTGAVIKLQRMLGLKLPEQFTNMWQPAPNERPVIFITHMEHHSNQTSWLETLAEVVCINPNADGLVDLDHFDELLEKYKDRKVKIASVTSCSNVTGVFTPYHQIAKKVHKVGGLCFVDFACSGPYVDINMHPDNPEMALDAIFFSPHKFLGGPGTTGILVFNKKLYTNKIPDNPGGGTVTWTNPWGGHSYIEDIETREDGGTPGFMQTIKAALAIKVKEEMGTDNIQKREHQLVDYVLTSLEKLDDIVVLANNNKERLGAISFYHKKMHYNLLVRILNDRFGIQTRGGCSCAGTYGHYLLEISEEHSGSLVAEIESGNHFVRPGWVRLSLHPTMTNKEVTFICESIANVCEHLEEYAADYEQIPMHNDYKHKTYIGKEKEIVNQWFNG